MPDSIELATILLIGLGAGSIAYFASSRLIVPRRSGSENSRAISWRIDLAFYGVVVAFFVVYALLDIGKFESFNLYGLDFALFDQTIWNSLHGRLFENTLVLDAPIILGQHFSIILLALVPLYAVYSDPRLLALLPAFCVAIASLPLYWFAQKQVGRGLAFAISIAFLLSPGVQFLALGQFYEIVLALPLLMLTGVFLLRQRWAPFFLSLAVVLLVKEVLALVALGFGLYIFLVQRKFKLGGILALASLIWFLALIKLIIPFFQGGAGFYYFGAGGYGSGQYAYLGNSLEEIIRTVITRPDIVVSQLVVPLKIDTVIKLVLPLGLFPLLGLEISALALPTLGYILLTDRELEYVLSSHHYVAVFPFLLLAVVVGVRRLCNSLKFVPSQAAVQIGIGVFLLTASVASYYLYSPGPLGRNFDLSYYTPTTHAVIGNTLARMIPSNAAVLSQMELSPQVAERSNIYVMPGIRCLAAADYLFADLKRSWYGYYQPAWDHALNASYFETVGEQDGFVLKKYRPLEQLENPSQAQFGNGIHLLGYSLPLTRTTFGGQRLEPVLGWRIDQAAPQRYAVELHLVDAQEHVWAAQDREPCRTVPVQQRMTGTIVNEDFVLLLPPTMPSGNYQLTVAIFDKEKRTYLEVATSADSRSKTELAIASLSIQKNKSSISARQLQIEHPLFVDMDEMRFLGYAPLSDKFSPGELVQVGLYWRARERPRSDYVVAVQLRDEEDKVVYEHANRPANDTYPTSLWDAGEILLDWHDFILPENIADGDYQIFVVLRETATQRVLGQTPISKISVTH